MICANPQRGFTIFQTVTSEIYFAERVHETSKCTYTSTYLLSHVPVLRCKIEAPFLFLRRGMNLAPNDSINFQIDNANCCLASTNAIDLSDGHALLPPEDSLLDMWWICLMLLLWTLLTPHNSWEIPWRLFLTFTWICDWILDLGSAGYTYVHVRKYDCSSGTKKVFRTHSGFIKRTQL